nr:hypothetical protein [Gordonia spumicola]
MSENVVSEEVTQDQALDDQHDPVEVGVEIEAEGSEVDDVAASSEVTGDGRAYLTYEQFGRRFFEVAVTEDRIGAAFTAIAGEEFQVGPIAAGPGGVVKVQANVKIAEPEITRQVADTITFTVKLPLFIGLVVDLKVDRIRYDVDGLVTLPLSVRCAEPLQLRIEVETPRPRDVFVDVASHNIRGSIIRYLAQVDDEIRRVIARFVADEVDKPEVKKARLIDVDVELGRAFEGM